MTTATLTTPEIRPVSRDALFLAVVDRHHRHPRRARSARRSAGLRRTDCRWLCARRGVPEIRVQLHRLVAALPVERRGGRPDRRPDRHRGHRARRRSARRAQSRLWRRDCADRSVAVHRLIRLRRRHAARQCVRLRYALHGGRRLRPHADCARDVHCRQRARQPVAAAGATARRHRSGAGEGLLRRLGRIGRHAGEHRCWSLRSLPSSPDAAAPTGCRRAATSSAASSSARSASPCSSPAAIPGA